MIWDELNKQLPFHEDEDYVKGLIEKSTDRAIALGSKPARHYPLIRVVVSAAASIVLLFVVAVVYLNNEKPAAAPSTNTDPLGQFLNGITDEEAKLIEYYEVE